MSFLQPQRPRPSVQLALNGKPVFLLNPSINITLKRDEADMSGQQSSTQKADKGVKAKEMTVSGLIPYREKQWLKDLFNFAEATEKSGEQVTYRVSSISAEAVNMREVQFSGSVSMVEQGDKMAWQVNFTLKEVNSVSEKKEKRKTKPKKKVQTEKAPEAKSTQPKVEATSKEVPKEDNSIWKKIDDAIGSGGEK
ncbi:hypothetical protein [Avibacterium paragallinarum]|uniref:baseplate complex protein n=1 Tax=Avibacterium paragallinarum TaxID=728 RepID=UPI00021ACC5D|nr:hypothetical protein [Avibacterium paragallinarum]QIR10928.1 hypothetical protein HBL79_00855 [Avibacterium paragallinarum]QLD64038.1 hypothetical protein VY92_000975 [Avibacterium paragallinarum]